MRSLTFERLKRFVFAKRFGVFFIVVLFFGVFFLIFFQISSTGSQNILLIESITTILSYHSSGCVDTPQKIEGNIIPVISFIIIIIIIIIIIMTVLFLFNILFASSIFLLCMYSEKKTNFQNSKFTFFSKHDSVSRSSHCFAHSVCYSFKR